MKNLTIEQLAWNYLAIEERILEDDMNKMEEEDENDF